MKLREVAYSRSGDKGDVSNVCVFPYRPEDYGWLAASLTPEVVKAKFAGLVAGEVVRYDVPTLKGFNFVLTRALAGGVSISLRADPHGKAYQSLILDIELDAAGRP
ncbi:MAG: hypothetical protein E6I08_00825 [Chloroflexi bacterium]|nr:MAG: hypothetical protein E6I08_00825 [Chloroflexota bacterium]